MFFLRLYETCSAPNMSPVEMEICIVDQMSRFSHKCRSVPKKKLSNFIIDSSFGIEEIEENSYFHNKIEHDLDPSHTGISWQRGW